MYKYVQRRLKEFVERTYNFLDVKKTWTCLDTQNLNGLNHNRGSALKHFATETPNSLTGKTTSTFSSSNGNEKCRHERFKYRPDHFYWISALTWSSALVCGWYASQLLCLHRRNLGWDTRCFYSKLLLTPSRALHTRVARAAFVAPFTRPSEYYRSTPHRQPKFQKVEEKNQEDSGVDVSLKNEVSYCTPNTFEDQEEFYDIQKFRINVKSEPINYEKTNYAEASTSEAEQPTVESAVQNLISVLGQIEFELGVRSLTVGDFVNAVSHLKLATSHHHAGATFNLGICFEQGLGVQQDMHLAMECYQAASDLGHPKAMYNLGVFYAHGLGGLKRSRKAAKRCFAVAAQLGVVEAQIALGMVVPSQDKPMENMFGAINLQNAVLVS